MQDNEKKGIRFFGIEELLQVLPFGKTKLLQLLNANALPVVKIGRDYVTSDVILNDWLAENLGKEIYY